jgi:2-polyprenyl-3-methyl-5-hydroxy-6-metoxy-1,4-benzoquinol methylase
MGVCAGFADGVEDLLRQHRERDTLERLVLHVARDQPVFVGRGAAAEKGTAHLALPALRWYVFSMNPLRPAEDEALAAWAALVAADAAQVARVREPEPPADHYAAQARRFRPGVMESPELELVVKYARPDDVWLDIGAGGGRFAVPLAGKVARIIAVEPSESMRTTLQDAASAAGRTNIDIRPVRWPQEGWNEQADVSLAAHVLYDISAIGPFLDAMERHTRRLCIVVMFQFARGWNLAPLFEAVHGEAVHLLPALKELVAVLGSRNRRYEVRTVTRPAATGPMPPDEAFELARRMLWLAPGSAKEGHMRTLMQRWWGTPDGIVMSPDASESFIGVVTWKPGG